MELAATIGISINDFWDMEPIELTIALKAFYKRKEIEAQEYLVKFNQEHDLIITGAYLISRWVWQKRININKFLITKVHKQMTQDEMYQQGLQLIRMFGGETDGEE